MLGRFLEYSVQSEDIPRSLEFYERLGFTQARVNDAWSHAYAVVTDGRLCIGLHADAPAEACLTFVRADILRQMTRLEESGIEITQRRLGNAEFNEIAFADPGGMLVRLIEARSFSPSDRKPNDFSTCGYFEQIALPSPDPATAMRFWEDQGFVGMEEAGGMLPHISCTSDHVDLGLYASERLREPMLVFEADDIHTRLARLAAAGLEPERNLPASLRGLPAALYRAPEGTLVLVRGLTD